MAAHRLDLSEWPWMVPGHRVPARQIPWDGGPNYYRRFDDDDGVHAGTWTYSKIISPVHGTWGGVKAVLRIISRKRKAHRYSLRLELSRVSVLACEARCTSVRDARDHADRIELSEALYTLLHKVYNKNRARCVFSADGTLFASVFDDLHCWRNSLPLGDYYDIDPVEHWQPQRRVHHTSVWGSGYCAGSVPVEHAEFAKTLIPWT